MPHARLPEEAFEFYVGLGANRSYQAVAEHYGISKRAVSYRANEERWRERLESLVRAVRSDAGDQNAADAAVASKRQASRVADLQDAMHEIMTPTRMKAVIASLFKAAVQKDDVAAARFLVERMLGRLRNEALPANAVDIPNGLETTADIRRAANTLVQAIADGSLAPEDAQRTATVLESARKSIEVDELERRIASIEETIRQDRVDGGAKK